MAPCRQRAKTANNAINKSSKGSFIPFRDELQGSEWMANKLVSQEKSTVAEFLNAEIFRAPYLPTYAIPSDEH